MPYPLIVVSLKNMTKKKTKKTKTVPIKKAVKKQAVPVRPSPFEIGECF